MSAIHSPSSSAGHAASSPFAGTDPTLYSPELARNAQHHRGNVSSKDDNVVSATPKFSVKPMVLPQPEARVNAGWSNEIAEDAPQYISRCQLVTQLPDSTDAGTDMDHELVTVQHQMKLYACFTACVPVYTRGVFLRFDDLRDSAEGKDILEQQGFSVEYVSAYQYAVAKSQETANLNEFEGQMKLSIFFDPNPDRESNEFTQIDYCVTICAVQDICKAFGPVRKVAHIATNDEKSVMHFRIEFHGVDAANRAVRSLAIDSVWGYNAENTFQWVTVNPGHWTGERGLDSPSRAQPRMDDEGRLVGYRPAANPLPSTPVYRHPSDAHNRVRRDRILDGSDVRTTIMLRNIPNKMDWLALKAVLDEQCFGTYDFMYLRIDFKSACNVGYAFINFANVGGMIALIDNIESRCWVGFRSNKAAEISYATIQGREALIQKFRNSSVMQETSFCRPRLFITSTDAEVNGKRRSTGTEQSFPRPDNLSKLQRSMDSARTIGLFPPHGYSNNAEHRHRGSGYDRGTPRDLLQAASQVGRQRAAPLPLTDLSEATKHDIEAWYTSLIGQGRVGRIPFDYIPMTYLGLYFAEFAAQPMPSNVGVIGGPAYGSGQTDVFGFATPGSRAHGSPSFNMSAGYSRPGRAVTDVFTNPFN